MSSAAMTLAMHMASDQPVTPETLKAWQAASRALMSAALDWSRDDESPQVRASRRRLALAFHDMILAILETAPDERREFIRHYPAFKTVLRHGLDMVEAGYPSRLSEATAVLDEGGGPKETVPPPGVGLNGLEPGTLLRRP